MIIELSKNIYSLDSIMHAKITWDNFFSKVIISQNKENYIMELETIKNDILVIKEFLNYILDCNSKDN